MMASTKRSPYKEKLTMSWSRSVSCSLEQSSWRLRINWAGSWYHSSWPSRAQESNSTSSPMVYSSTQGTKRRHLFHCSNYSKRTKSVKSSSESTRRTGRLRSSETSKVSSITCQLLISRRRSSTQLSSQSSSDLSFRSAPRRLVRSLPKNRKQRSWWRASRRRSSRHSLLSMKESQE